MKQKLFISICVLLAISMTLFLWRVSLKDGQIRFFSGADSRLDVMEQEEVPPDIPPEIRFQHYPTPEEKAARIRLHPLADDEAYTAARTQPVSTWEEWLDGTTEIILGQLVSWGRFQTPEEVEAQRQKTRAELAEVTAPLRATEPPPKDLQQLEIFKAKPPEPKRPKPYEGPQTPEALIAEYDERFLQRTPESAEWDTHFPKAAFLQRVLDRGYEFKGAGSYAWALKLRRDLIQMKEKPEVWRSGSHGIPITTDYQEYVDGYIDRKMWQFDITTKVSEENPGSATTVFFPPWHPDKYLPQVGKITYVHRGPDSSLMRTWGTPLTKEQRDDILYRGKPPEDIEIVYIDEDYNVLSEKPKPYNREEWLRANTYDYVPEGLRAPDGSIVTPEQYEEIFWKPMPAEMQQRYEAYAATQSSGDEREAMRAAAREAAEAERVKFEQGLRELERLMNMNDTEIAAELERRFTPRLPELPTDENLENRLWSEIQPNRLTPARFEAAFRILEQYGPEEGMHRLHTADPKLAAQVRHFFGQPPAERPPEKPNTAESPQPPEGHPERR